MRYTLVHFEPPQGAVVRAALRTIGAERTVDQILAAVRVVWGQYDHDAENRAFPAARRGSVRARQPPAVYATLLIPHNAALKQHQVQMPDDL